MNLEQMHRIKRWLVDHQREHPVEYHLWDAMLMLWVIGWVGWLPAFTFQALWAAPLLALLMSAPTLYVTWRLKAHQAQRLRCDWLVAR
jgi:energy-converting hydrogenase Eha subunit G